MSSSLQRLSRSLFFSGLMFCGAAVEAGVTYLGTYDQDPMLYSEGSINGDGFSGNKQNFVIGTGSYYGRTNSFVSANYSYGPDVTKAWSISTWVRSDVDTGLTDTVARWNSQVDYTSYAFRSNATSRFSLDVGSKQYVWRTPTNLLNQKWHHLVLSSATGGAPYRLFCDGVESTSAATANITAAGIGFNTLSVGASTDYNSSPGSNWDGWIDDFAVLDEAVTPELAAALKGLGIFGIGLTDYRPITALLSSPLLTPVYLRGVRWEKVASGLTGAIGSTGGTLTGGDAYIVTGSNGAGLRISPPLATGADLTFSPSDFSATTGFGQKAVLPAQITNSSTTRPLQWQISGPTGRMPSLEGIGHLLTDNTEAILAPLPDRAFPATTLTNGSIMNGPYSSYSSGNNLTIVDAASTSYSSTLPFYTAPAVHEVKIADYFGNPGVGSARYTTLFRPDFNVLSADLTNVGSVILSGNNYSGSSLTSTDTITVRGLNWDVYYFSTPGYNSNLAIHHVFLTPAGSGIVFTPSTSNEYVSLTKVPASCRLHHLWYTTEGTDLNVNASTTAMVRAFLELSHAPASFIQIQPSSGTLAPGASMSTPVVLDSTGLLPGDYSDQFAITARGEDPGANLLTARLSLVGPQFTALAPPLALPVIMGEIRHTDKILLTAANGFSLSQVSAVSSASWLRAVASENRIGELDLYIDTTGMAAGTYTTNVTITVGQTVQTVPVTIKVEGRQITRLIADPIRPRVYALAVSNGYNSSSTNKIQVLDSTTGRLLREMDAPGVSNIALSADCSRLYAVLPTVNAYIPSITSFDLLRFVRSATTVTSTSLAPEGYGYGIAQIAGGPGDTIVYTSAYDNSLIVQNAATGDLIQKISSPEPGQTFGSITLSGDRTTLLVNTIAGSEYSGAATPAVRQFTFRADGSLAAVTGGASNMVSPSTSSVSLSSTPDGRYLVSGDRIYDTVKNTNRSLTTPLLGLSAGGEFAVGNAALFSPDGTRFLADQNTINVTGSLALAITHEGRIFCSSNSSSNLLIYDVRALLGDAKAGYTTAPEDDSIISIPASFRWLPVEGSREYHVYASRDANALQSDVPAAGTEIAVTPLYTLANPLTSTMNSGETWYWRVDAAAPQGRVRGTVANFTVTSLPTDVESLNVTTIRGCRAQPAEVRILPKGGTGTATWTASSDRAWMTLESTTGTTATPVRIKINAVALPGYNSSATLTLKSGGMTRQIPVNATALAVSSTLDIESASDVNTAFALVSVTDTNYYNSYYLLRLDPLTATPLDSRQVDPYPRALRLSPDQSVIAVESAQNSTGPGTASLEIFDSVTLKPLKKLINGAMPYDYSSISRTALGPDGKAIFGRRLVHWPDSQILGTVGSNQYGNRSISAFSADGKWLYASGYYSIYKMDANSPTVDDVKSATTSDYSYSAAILTSRSTAAFAVGSTTFDQDLNLLNTGISGALTGVSRSGTLATSGNVLYHFPSLRPLAQLTNYLNLPTFDDRNSNLISLGDSSGTDGAPAFMLTPYKALLPINQSTLTPGIADGALVGTSGITLSWSDVPSAGNYRVYLSTSLGKIELAQPGDATEIGTTFGTSMVVKTPLLPNTTYYWKLILDGAASSASSPEWSFHTSNFVVNEGSVAMGGPIDCAPLSHDVQLTAPADSTWSVTTTTPWLQTSSSGTGSGTIHLVADPAGLPEGTTSGSVTLTIGSETLTIPVTLRSFAYQVRTTASDPDSSYAHQLVVPSVNQSSGTPVPVYLIKIDLATHKVLEALDTGLLQASNYSLTLTVHPEDNRLYLYNGANKTIYGFNRTKYALEQTLTTAALPEFNPDRWTGALVSAGPGRMAMSFQYTGISVYSTSTGALLSTLPVQSNQYTTLVSAKGGRRIYGLNLSYFAYPPAAFDISENGIISAGPVAAGINGNYGYNYGFGVTADNQKLYYQGLLFDQDLNLLSPPLPTGQLMFPTADGSLLLMYANSGYYFASTDGMATSPYFNIGAGGGSSVLGIDPNAPRYLYASASDIPRWVEVLMPASGAIPQTPGSLWVTYGHSTWTPDASRPGVLTNRRLKDPATNLSSYNTSDSYLAFTPRVAGTLSFSWRSTTTSAERVGFSINGTERASVTGNSDWAPVLITVAAGDRVLWDYNLPYYQNPDKNASVELRGITFTPSLSASTVSVGISPTADRDGDGFSDLMEAALGTDPSSAASRPVAGLVMSGAAPSRTAAYVYERPAVSAYQFTVQVSQDLVTWQDLAAENATVTALTADRQQVAMPLPTSAAKSFTRLKVADAASK